MDLRCTTDKYDALYARWTATPGTLLDLGGYKPGMRVLDLCGGTGAVSREVLRRGGKPEDVLLVDLNPRCPDPRVQQRVGDAHFLGGVFADEQPQILGSFDLIVCRQAMAYLDLNSWPGRGTASWLMALLVEGGRFVFNIFEWPKWAKPWHLSSYCHDDVRFFEVALKWRDRVWHVQASPGIGVDVTRFHIHTEKTLRGWFQGYFGEIEVQRVGNSRRWVCTRRSIRRSNRSKQ